MINIADYLTAFLSNQNVLSLIIALVINLGWLGTIIIIGKGKKSIPVKLFLLNFFIWLGLFINAGMTDILYAMIYIITVAGLITYIYAKQFAEGQATYQKIFISYMVFFASVTFFEGLALATSPVISADIPAVTDIKCDLGLIVIDGLLRCGWGYLSLFFSFFTFSSSIGIINTILVVPFIIFVVLFILDWVRGR